MIKISGCSDTVFEEAYFILKPGVAKDILTEHDLIIEANRIIRESSYKSEKPGQKFIKISPIAFFSLIISCIAGIGVALLAFLL